MKLYLDRLLARHMIPSHSNGFFPWATSHAPKDSLVRRPVAVRKARRTPKH